MVKMITCKECNEVKVHEAKGMCSSCYSKHNKMEKFYQELLKTKKVWHAESGTTIDRLIMMCKERNIRYIVGCESRCINKNNRLYMFIELLE